MYNSAKLWETERGGIKICYSSEKGGREKTSESKGGYSSREGKRGKGRSEEEGRERGRKRGKGWGLGCVTALGRGKERERM